MELVPVFFGTMIRMSSPAVILASVFAFSACCKCKDEHCQGPELDTNEDADTETDDDDDQECDDDENCDPDSGQCDPACDPEECLECSDGECVLACEDGQECDGAGNCVPASDDDDDEPRPPPSHLTRATTQCLWSGASPQAGVDCTTWSGLFTTEFPSASSAKQFFLDPESYIALEFNPGDYVGDRSGRLAAIAPQFGAPATFPGGRIITTISRFPGDFHRDAIIAESEPACYSDTGPVLWSTEDYSGFFGPTSVFCALEPNRTYYYNIVFTNSPAGAEPEDLVWWCSTSATQRCGRLLQVMVD